SYAGEIGSCVNVVVVLLFMGAGKSREWMATQDVPQNVKVIYLSMDFRAMSDDSPFVYGLPEKYRRQIATTNRVANPGCLATSIELALLPLAETRALHGDIVAHTLTGSTGAGQQPVDTTHFSWRHSNLDSYKVFQHQHEVEIKQTLGEVNLNFVPLRAPFSRGIYATCVIPGLYDSAELTAFYRAFYDGHPFVVVRDTAPDVKSVVNTNMCHLGILSSDTALLIVSVIDNLMKGASGQAIQNMNIMFGLDETAGLLTKASAF
ncbi:MAG: Asd/ArgC dimerization domain-containing protein, partial [Ignavibacteria bacterium]